ncbi:ABC transporter ATP-binding protein [Rhizomonospora bruguierae]|uniref:ABC transporter ATP-binding protein n=1 Tax=Rhizomonospora bruguierae TaxID=1581705 RepID=UPI001BCAF2A7|nr:ABC transporter ATP-binding protein [Micromonospora sp. NBRC 107566]
MAEHAGVGEGASIHLANVAKSYHTRAGETFALEGVGLDVEPNEFVALLGPSGCGKSTLLKLVSGLEPATAGSIHVGDDLVVGPRPDVGFCFQRDNLLEWRKVIDNVLLPAEIKGRVTGETRQRAEALLTQVGLERYGSHYPYQLSGGMRQRAALCRALLLDATMMLMDEPFGALDALSRERHQILLQDVWMKNRITVLFVTHDIREAVFLADRVVLMSPAPGRVSSITTIQLPRPRVPQVFETEEFLAYVSALHRELFASEWEGANP